MTKRIITEELMVQYGNSLRENERAGSTVEKYIRDVRKLQIYAAGREITKELMLDYREHLQRKGYKTKSINSFLVAANRFFVFMEWRESCIRLLKMQEEVFADEAREMSKEEYRRLVQAARKLGKKRLALILVTICATGIRVSELCWLTAEALRKGRMTVRNKGKSRTVILPEQLCTMLRVYAAQNRISSGVIFRTANGNPVNRSNLWKEMKSLCEEARVDAAKVFPHNLRHLFARLFYAIDKNIVKLANILGHASIETTRIYLRTSAREYMGNLQQMGVILNVWEEDTT